MDEQAEKNIKSIGGARARGQSDTASLGAAESTVSLRSTRVIATGCIVTLAPLVLLMFNADWFFTREGYLDPWNYVGLFREYLDPEYLPEEYKLARLPWILAGFLAHSSFNPVVAAYVLHAVFLCATSLALYVGLLLSLKRPALAAVVAMCLGFYTPAHGSGGWDYHNTATGAFYLATFALLAFRSTVDGSRIMLAITGAMAALAIHTNITLVNFVPALVLVYGWTVWLRTDRVPSLRSVIVRTGWCLLGAALVTIVLGFINWNVGRRFLFFGILLDIVIRFVGDSRNVAMFHQPWSSGFLWTARYLSLPAAVFVAGIAFLVTVRHVTSDFSQRLASALVLQFLIMAVVWIAWQSAGQVALDIDYFAYVLTPSCFIALAGLLSHRWPAWCERHWLVTLTATWVLLASYLGVAGIPGAETAARVVAPSGFIAIGTLMVAPLLLALWRPSVVTVAIVIAAFALSNRLVASSADYLIADGCKLQPQVYNAIVDGASWLMKTDPLYRRVRIWFDENELIQPVDGCPVRVSHMSNSIRTMASMGYVIQKFPMPAIAAVPDASLTAVTEGDRLMVIITDRPAVLDAWTRRLDAMGLVPKSIDSHRVPVLNAGFTIHAWTVSRDPHTVIATADAR
jgi:hypothetical protein